MWLKTIPFLQHQPAQSPTNQDFHVACGFQIKFPKDKVAMLEIMQVEEILEGVNEAKVES